MTTALDQEFETGVRLIRDAYSKKVRRGVVVFFESRSLNRWKNH
jgi:hypothetical protein